MAEQNGLAWLKAEYKLSDEEFRRIEEAHDAYYPKCMEMCKRIAQANRRVTELLQTSTTLTPEIEAALKTTEATNAECRAAMLRHIYQVAAMMPPDQGSRYIRETAPRLLSSGHAIDEVMLPEAGMNP